MEDFKLPRDAYPESYPQPTDSEIKEFNSQSADLLRYANGGTQADKTKLRAMGADRLLGAFLELADGRYYTDIDIIRSPHEFFDSFVDTLKTISEDTNVNDHSKWPKAFLRYLLSVGYDGNTIRKQLKGTVGLPEQIQQSFDAAAVELDLPRIFAQ